MSTFVYSNVILWYLVDKGRRVWTRGKKDRKQWTIELEKGQNWGLHAAGKCKMAPIWSAHKSVSFLNLDVGILGKLWLDLDSKRKQTNPEYLEYVSLLKASCTYEVVQCKHASRASSRKGVALSWQAQAPWEWSLPASRVILSSHQSLSSCWALWQLSRNFHLRRYKTCPWNGLAVPVFS